jgi:hypothetical protein
MERRAYRPGGDTGRCRADVNPIERCWRWFRDHVTHPQLFETLEELMDAAEEFFREVASHHAAVLARLGQM